MFGFSRQLVAHCVEGFDIGQLHFERLGAGIAHDKENEAVKVNVIHGKFAASGISVFTGLKIQLSKIARALFNQIADVC